MTRFDLPPPPPGILERSNLEAMEAFLAALAAAGASPKTVKAYRAAISDFLSFIGDKRLREVTSSDVSAWIYDRLTRGLQRPRSRDSDPAEERRERQTTMHYYTLFLRGFLEWLGLNVKVPVVRKPRSPRVEALRPEEVERLVSAARDPLDLLIVALLFETGLRAQEAVGLRLRDIDTGRREIRVRNAKYGEERVVLYGPLTEQALAIWLALNPKLGPDDPLLGISYSGLYKRLKTLARRAGLDPRRVRPHVLRHTFATEALRRGVPLPVVQRLLGHHDIKVTQIYLHLLDEDIRAAYQRAFATQPAAQTPQGQAPAPVYAPPRPLAQQPPMPVQPPGQQPQSPWPGYQAWPQQALGQPHAANIQQATQPLAYQANSQPLHLQPPAQPPAPQQYQVHYYAAAPVQQPQQWQPAPYPYAAVQPPYQGQPLAPARPPAPAAPAAGLAQAQPPAPMQQPGPGGAQQRSDRRRE
ncbi:Site-specific recombinase XerD [Pyrodictium delaneyi]|uniref:Tyrosine recombinase XerA n=1 Tax=Pyrodictium delaneyi TaxID=1273541 RepID=A0A0P0N287_9CREN|nr:tyrosine-type recombinase/integrase [Pyrodictium delaneyi]ALL00414.1 Site-specific recombinase XerD [Pyrodictium delaneyi]OWJ54180.1 integrase [Pyrodictium delaneyi]